MFESSPRPTKQQKLDGEPHSSPRTPRGSGRKSTRRSVLTYSGRRGVRSPAARAIGSADADDVEEAGETEHRNGAFIDSAYQSMGMTQNELSYITEQVETPSKKRQRQHNKAAGKVAGSDTERHGPKKRAGTLAKSDGVPLVNKDLESAEHAEKVRHEDPAPEGDTITVRSSNRARKKTWKSAAADEDARKARSVSTKRVSQEIAEKSTSSRASRVIDFPSHTTTHEDQASAKTPQNQASGHTTATPQSKRKRGRPPKHSAPLEESQDIGLSKRASERTRDNEDVPISTPKKKINSDTPLSSKITVIDTEVVQLDQTFTGGDKSGRTELEALLGAQQSQELLEIIKEDVMGHLTSTRLKPIVGENHLMAYRKVYKVLEHTVLAGEGNSMLLIGARGTAKSTVVDTALLQLRNEYQDDFHVVQLNGFFQTDDKLALKEIWRQLGKEMNVEDGSMDDRGNYADTLASLLALLSQPGELLLGEKRETASKSVIFVLNEFDLFTSHPRQTLLYNLFDIAQSRKAPIAVLGLTTRIDIVENLEKRVKSRFSHRYVHFSLPKTYLAFLDIIKAILLALPPDSATTQWPSNQMLSASRLSSLIKTYGPRFRSFHATWCNYISSLLSAPVLETYLKRTYHQTKSTSTFLNSALLPIASISPTNLPTPASFLQNTLHPSDSKLDLLPSLSELQLALLIAAARLDIILETDTCNFNMAYNEYTSLAQRARAQASASGALALGGSQGGGKVWGRERAIGAWE